MQSPQSTSNGREPHAPSYFDLQATWGVTKHFGGTQSTDELATLCQIDRDASVLDVGCGTGMTPCYLAQTVGCHVVGVDISEDMIVWSTRRAHRACLDDRVTWKTFGSLLVTSVPFRRYLRELWPSRSVFHMFDYLGYGVFVGRKSATGTQARTEEYDAATDLGAA